METFNLFLFCWAKKRERIRKVKHETPLTYSWFIRVKLKFVKVLNLSFREEHFC